MAPYLKSLRKMFRLLAAGLLLGCGMPGLAASPIRVAIDPGQPGRALDGNFTGLSFEMNYVLADTNGNHFFSPHNTALIAMFKTLGVKSLRVGGNTADRPTLPTPDTADVDSLFRFAKAAGVKVIYTLRLREGSLSAATDMANYIQRHYGDQLDCFAIGNEPNVFSKEFPPYLAEWKKYAAEITAPGNAPAARFCGPSTSPGHETWARDFAIEFGNRGPLALISQHDYPGGDARRATNAAAARDKILDPAMAQHYAKFAANWVPEVLSNGLPYRLEEANSFYDGGALDVSDTFTAALWALDYQWWWASHGACGINFHTGDKVAARDESKPCRYAVFWTSATGYDVHPIAYGLKMFSLGAQGRQLAPAVANPDKLNLAVYAAEPGPRALCVTLINREHGPEGRTAHIELAAGSAGARGNIMLLKAPGGDVAAKAGVTLGGAEIQDDGRWDGKWTPLPQPGANGTFTLSLPAASAALVQINGQ